MQAEDIHLVEVEQLFAHHTPPPSLADQLTAHLRHHCDTPPSARQFLITLCAHSHSPINFAAFAQIVRVVKRRVVRLGEAELQLQLSGWLLEQASRYFPFPITAANSSKFQRFIRLLRGLPLPSPKHYSSQQALSVFLQAQVWGEEWAEQLLERISSEVLVDRKNQSGKLKLNPFFAPFVVKHFGRLLPHLQRLLVRSESNFEVWADFATAVAEWKGLEPHVLGLLASVKHLLPAYPETAVRLVNALTRSLRDPPVIGEVTAFLGGLVAGEHNSKRKMVYLRMLEGLADALTGLPEPEASPRSEQLVVIVAVSLPKFSEEEEFNQLAWLLAPLLPLLTAPSAQLATALAPLLKSNNKYTLVLALSMLSAVYRQVHISGVPAVRQVWNTCKSLLPQWVKKAESSWQWLLPAILFLSEGDQALIDQLTPSLPLFRASCLGLTLLERRTCLQLLLRYLNYLRSEEEELEDHLYVLLALLLEEGRERHHSHAVLHALSPEDALRVASRGVLPLRLFPCAELRKNRGNSFHSLLVSIWQRLRGLPLPPLPTRDYLALMVLFAPIKPAFAAQLDPTSAEAVQAQVEDWLRASLRVGEEEEGLNEAERKNVEVIVGSLRSYPHQYLPQLLHQFAQLPYYTEDLQFLTDFRQRLQASYDFARAALASLSADLIARGFHRPPQQPPRKTYVGLHLEVRMMSEAEVKEEKYRRHFLQMASLFDQIAARLLCALLPTAHSSAAFAHALANSVWRQSLQSLLAVTRFPELRLSVRLLVLRSCLLEARFNAGSADSRLLVRHSGFLGEFFGVRESGITPAVRLMNRCETFLKEILELEWEECVAVRGGEGQFTALLLNAMCEFLLENMEFDVNLKKLAVRFYLRATHRGLAFANHELLFTHLVANINILAAAADALQPLLADLLPRVGALRIKELFADILNFVLPTKRLILKTVAQLPTKYRPEFEEFIKLKILALESDGEVREAAGRIVEGSEAKSILGFNMTNFVRKNSKETIEKLCQFIREEITPDNAHPVFELVMRTSEELYDQGFDQEGLEMFPYFLALNLPAITPPLLRPIFKLLISKFTAKEEFATLSKLSVEVGVNIIRRLAPTHAEELLLVLESFINTASGVSNIVFLGVLAPYLQANQNLQLIENRITELFRSDKQAEQKAIARCMADLMSFFKHPDQMVEQIFTAQSALGSEPLQVGQAYLFAGLLKGIGYKLTQAYLERVLSKEYLTKTRLEKSGRIHLVNALVENFGRVVEMKSIRIIELMISYTADNSEEIRSLAKRTGQTLIMRMSSFSVKVLLPQLLRGLEEEQNWRIKISYIWILGIMANCSAKQLQTSLPIIVPTLSTCLSNAHPTIREKASEALNLIGQTIKNPEISQCVDILIEALENPFEKSEKAIDILLKTSFSHYMDPPALSMIIPILDYSMRGRVSDLKAGACQVIGSIVELIANSYDLLPYLRIITTGLRVALCDPLPEIRCIAAMAIGKISAKIGIKQAESYFRFVLEIIESPLSNTTERQGAAQAFAEMICSHSYEYFEESLGKIFEKLGSIKHSEKEGYILVFLYVPSIRTVEFEGFIGEVNANMYAFVSDEEESIRNSAMMVEKVLISNYCLTHTDLLLGPLCDGVFENNWKKRNAALILLGELLNILKSHLYNTRSNDKAYAYYRALMAVYIIKDDELEMTRLTANQVWNAYIENTPKTIKQGLPELVRMWTRWTHSANGVVFNNIVAFSGKYGENYFGDILDLLVEALGEPEQQVGVFQVLAEFIKRLNLQFLSRETYRTTLRQLFSEHIFTIPEQVRSSLTACLALYVDKMHEERFFEELVYPALEAMDTADEGSEVYTRNLHLVKDLLRTSSAKVVDRVISKVMQPPMSEFKIEVITNNADRLANYLYTHFPRPATEVLVDEIYTLVAHKDKENRLALITYCLEQVSLQLTPRHKAMFVRMLHQHIYKLLHAMADPPAHTPTAALTRPTLLVFVNMLVYFLNSTPLSEIQDLDTLIGQLSPLVFLADPQLQRIGHRIYLLLVGDHRNQRTAEYLRQMVVSFENKAAEGKKTVWEDEVVLHDYVQMLVKGIAYGTVEVMEDSLDMAEFLLSHTAPQLLESQVLRLVGPVLRICNYPLMQKQKLRALQLLGSVLASGFSLAPYTVPILSVCLRLLAQYRSSQEVVRVVADTYLALLLATPLRQQLLLQIMGKLKTGGANFVHAFYYLMKDIIKKEVELPRALLEKAAEECYALLTHSEGKLPVKALYYASKVAARIWVFLRKPIQRSEAQLSAPACPYENVLGYLHFAYYQGVAVPRMGVVEIFIKESPREKVHYLLKSLKLCAKKAQSTRVAYSQEYVRGLVPQTLSGFDDIVEMVQCFQSEKQEEEIEVEVAEININ